MKKLLLFNIFFAIFFVNTYSQEKYVALTINPELKEKSNAVVRSNKTVITIEAINKMVIKEHRIVTVLNELGKSKVDAIVYYDKSINIRNLEAKIYDKFGKQIKKIKKKEFKDVSVADGFSIFTDNRAKYLEYTPVDYPYTVEFEVETLRTNTAFIPKWFPIEGYHVSTEFSSINVINNSGIELTKKASNLKKYQNIKMLSEFNYEAINVSAIKYEEYSPSFINFSPNLKLALKEFSMEGVKGSNNNWQDFGKWINDKLIKGTDALPESTINEVKELTKNATTPIEKAKIVYNYMQNKTRYVSIQVGIGGWKPMLAEDVNRLGYGDCKGLTNYTKALLKAVNVESFYTVVYGSRNIKNIDKDFSSLQGNHVILSIPNNNDYIWLECTSQDAPFGYNANFTDDRDVLIVNSEGGKIEHTKEYKTNNNTQKTTAKVFIDSLGNIKDAKVNVEYKGLQYSNHRRIESKPLKKQKIFYKKHYSNINNLNILSINLNNNKEQVVFTENLNLEALNYASKAGNKLLLAPNMFNKSTHVPPRYRKRKLPFEIDRGYIDEDEYIIKIPNNFTFENLIDDINISNKFGEYSISIQKIENNKIQYKRKLKINKGQYLKEDYKIYRKFRLDIVNKDKSLITINKL